MAGGGGSWALRDPGQALHVQLGIQGAVMDPADGGQGGGAAGVGPRQWQYVDTTRFAGWTFAPDRIHARRCHHSMAAVWFHSRRMAQPDTTPRTHPLTHTHTHTPR